MKSQIVYGLAFFLYFPNLYSQKTTPQLTLFNKPAESWRLQKKGQYDKALASSEIEVENARILHRNGEIHDTVFITKIELAGTLNFVNSKLEKALPLRREVVEVRERYYNPLKTSSYVKYMDALCDVAQLCFYLGHLEEAAQYCQKAYSIGIRHPVKPQSIAHVDHFPYTELANTYQFIGNLQKAEEIHKSAIKFYEEKLVLSKNKINSLSSATTNSTDYYVFEQYYYAAIECLRFYENTGLYYKEEALLDNFEKLVRLKMGKGSPNYGLWINVIAAFNAGMGRYEHSLALTEEADETFKGQENTAVYSTILNQYGMVYWFKNDFKTAQEFYEMAIRTSRKNLGIGIDEISAWVIFPTNLSYCYFKNGEIDKAIKTQKKALTFYVGMQQTEGAHIKNHGWYQTMSFHMGLFLQAKKQYDSAEVYLQRALRNNVIRHPQRILMARALGGLYSDMKKVDEARDIFLGAFQLHFNIIDQNFNFFSDQERSYLLRDMEKTQAAFKDFVFRYLNEKPSLAEDLYNIQLRTKSILANASKSVNEGVIASGNIDLHEKYQEWKYSRDRLAKYYQWKESERKAQNIDVVQLAAKVNSLEKEISMASENFAAFTKGITWQDVLTNLGPDEAAVEIIRNEQAGGGVKYLAISLVKGIENPTYMFLPSGDSLENRYYSFYKNSIQNSREDNLSYRKYWQPIRDKLSGVKRAFVSVDGVYNKVSLRTLRNPDTQKYLADELDVQIVSTTNELVVRRNSKIKLSNITLTGFPDYSGNAGLNASMSSAVNMDSVRFFLKGSAIAALPGTKNEVLTIGETLRKRGIKVEQFLDRDATEQRIKQLQSPQILHIATHGFFLPDVDKLTEDFLGYRPQTLRENPLLRSGLLLASAQSAIDGNISKTSDDGILTAFEAATLNLNGTELVVLSACETGLGEIKNGEGVYGLQRAFQLAGAKSILMSLWKVDDTATKELMILFYQELIKTGDKTYSFNSAQNQLRNKFPDPRLWGAFVFLEK